MKKFALILISVFTIFGGLFLSSCGKEISLSVDRTSVTIITNDNNPGEAGFYKEKSINVTLQNSSAGVYLEVLKGGDSIHVYGKDEHYAAKKTDGQYVFTIYGTKTGEATVRVSAVEDRKKFADIDVLVKTSITGIFEKESEDRPEGDTDKFAVRENRATAQGKQLVFSNFFTFDNNETADMNEIGWTFAENDDVNNKILGDPNLPTAEIKDGKLFVYENFNDGREGTIRLKAYFTQKESVCGYVDFTVLNEAAVSSLVLTDDSSGDKVLIGDNKADNVEFSLVRNDSNFSTIRGRLVVDGTHMVNLEPVFLKKSVTGWQEMTKQESDKLFAFSSADPVPDQSNQANLVYNFEIDTRVFGGNWLTGTYKFFLRLKYVEFAHRVDLSYAQALINLSFGVENVQVSGEAIKGKSVDVYSSYAQSIGCELNVLLKPEQVLLDAKYRIKVNLRQRSLQNFKLKNDQGNYNVSVDQNNLPQIVGFFDSNGKPILCDAEKSSANEFVSTLLPNNESIYVLTGRGVESVIEGVEIEFVPESYSLQKADLTLNLYRVWDDSEIQEIAVTENGGEVAERFVSSSRTNGKRFLSYSLEIDGLSSTNGLTVVCDNPIQFHFTGLERGAYQTGENPSMICNFTVELSGYGFSARTAFHFEHITGRRSKDFYITAFVPLDSASVENANKQSSSVIEEASMMQGYVVDGQGNISAENFAYEENSLAKLVLEAGSGLPLNFKTSALSERGIEIKFLPVWASLKGDARFDQNGYYTSFKNEIVANFKNEPEYADFTEEELVDMFFNNTNNLNFLVTHYFRTLFGNADNRFFAINTSNGRLTLTNNAFKGYVAVLFNGWQFDEETGGRVEATFARVFALESMFSVRSLTTSISQTTLYTTETLSIADRAKSYVDVSISLRNDQNIPTYNSLDFFTFVSNKLSSGSGDEFFDGFDKAESSKYFKKNDYYTISEIKSVADGRILSFRITADSTKFEPYFDDILTIYYDFKDDDFSTFVCKAEIKINILNVDRVEKVVWNNKTDDNEIYFNMKSADPAERSFTISASVMPPHANDTSLFLWPDQSFNFAVSQSGLDFNFTLKGSATSGNDFLYILPSDMIKDVEGNKCILAYRYDDDGNFLETEFIPLEELTSNVYDDLVGNGETGDDDGDYCNYFLNNDKKKVYNKDIILRIRVIIADGKREETAIRIYSANELANIDDTSCYYQIMNNLTLENWKTIPSLSGGIFGRDDTITLNFTGNSQTFVGELSGKIHDLTFAGNVSALPSTYDSKLYAGYVANVNLGEIENVAIDVFHNSVEDKYESSTFEVGPSSALFAVGGAVGLNLGTISGVTTGGLTINAKEALFVEDEAAVGGLVGENLSVVKDCSVEFFKFDDGVNKISVPDDIVVGGIAGRAGASSEILRSYVFAYPYVSGDVSSVGKIVENGDSSARVGAFVGRNVAGAKVEQSFAFLGNVEIGTCTEGENGLNLRNSYITSKADAGAKTTIFVEAQEKYVLTETSGETWQQVVSRVEDIFDENGGPVWATGESLDPTINFGFVHLFDLTQNVEVDTTTLIIKSNLSPLQSLQVGTGNGVLFRYALADENTVLTNAEKSALERRNTIDIQSLFSLAGEDLTERQADGLLVSASSNKLRVGAKNIQILGKSNTEISLSVQSKMDLTNKNTFKILILDYLPSLTTTINDTVVEDGQILLLQKGRTQRILHNLDNSISLNGTVRLLSMDDCALGFEIVDGPAENVKVEKSGTAILVTGKESHENEATTTLKTFVQVNGLSAGLKEYTDQLDSIRTRTFEFSVYNGATALSIEDAQNVNFKTAETASFNVMLATDSPEDDLVFEMEYAGRRISMQNNSFRVDDNLSLDVSWNKIDDFGNGTFRYRVLLKVSNATKHKVESAYENLKLFVNSKSQEFDSSFAKSISVSVLPQEIEDVSLTLYAISGRSIRNSTMYYRTESKIINTMTPSADAILAVSVSPAFAKMTSFTLSHNAPSSTVILTKLAYNPSYGFYADSTNATYFENGVRVNMTETDKQGSGIYYFRVLISGNLKDDFENPSDGLGGFTFTVDFLGGVNSYTRSQDVAIDILPEAKVFVKNLNDINNDEVEGSSTYFLAKGESAAVVVRVGKDQNLYNLTLEKAGANISMSGLRLSSPQNASYKEYTAVLTAYVNATLANGESTGMFYVSAEVERVVNGIQDIKTSRALICLVDFTVDARNISLFSGSQTENLDGEEYPVFQTYVGGEDTLRFEYPLLPEVYNYDHFNAEEIAAVEYLLGERRQFENTNSYQNPNAQYYINCSVDETDGTVTPLSLKEQLYFVDNGIETPIFNGSFMNENRPFNISEDDIEGGFKQLKITGIVAGTRQHMRLRTRVIYQDIHYESDFDFIIAVDTWVDEEAPIQIFSGEDFVKYANEAQKPGDYILMNDIVLENYQPIQTTEMIRSLDGNGFTIHLNSFDIPSTGNLQLALFNHVTEGTTIKNVRVNIFGAGQIEVDINAHTQIQIAGFVITNDGIIYNCEVVSYQSEYQKVTRSTNGIVVSYTNGANGDPIEMTQSFMNRNNIQSAVAGFAYQNNASIVNSRVGGESFKHIITVDDINYVETVRTGTFTIQGQGGNRDAGTGGVAGFVFTNSNGGNISACFADNVQINNKLDSVNSISAGFVISNQGKIGTSYVEGKGAEDKQQFNLTTIDTKGFVAGFVLSNTSLIKNSYANIAIEMETDISRPAYAAGFVYENEGEIDLCYTACSISRSDINELPFSGVDYKNESLNSGTINFSYFFNTIGMDDTNQGKFTTGAIAVGSLTEDPEEQLYGFSFATDDKTYDGIWKATTTGITLVAPNKIAMSNRYAVENADSVSLLYSRAVVDINTFEVYNLSYGSENNPIIIRDAIDFAVATGSKETANRGNSAYREYFTDTEVTGTYRLVDDIDLAEIDQNVESPENNGAKLTTVKKTLKGTLEGNGFAILNLNLNLNESALDPNRLKSIGLFSKLENAVVMNLDLKVGSVLAGGANFVGALAGYAEDSRIVSISIEKASDTQSEMKILGYNVAGGVVGALFGRSKMLDVSVNGISVEAKWWNEDKKIGDNEQNILQLQTLPESQIVTVVRELSYAGAIAGFVDVDNKATAYSFATFDTELSVNKFDLINMKARGSVRVYAEVVGGLFGYIGQKTYVYDAGIVLDASNEADENEMSYIISPNLYAGGIVGESYGGFFGSFAQYVDEIQDQIEEGAHGYYSNGSQTVRGQDTIFYHVADFTEETFSSNPVFVGGFAGLMGGGFVTKSYSKLNVVSKASGTWAVGGFVGAAISIGNKFALKNVVDQPSADIYFEEVYASGDVYNANPSKTGVSSTGLVGGLWTDQNHGYAQIAFKKTLAVNLLSFDSEKRTISGDTEQSEKSATHFVLVGKIYSPNGVVDGLTAPYPYIIDSTNNYTNAQGKNSGSNLGDQYVGGFNKVIFGSTTIKIDFFGFGGTTEGHRLLEMEPMGNGRFGSMSAAYSYLAKFFLQSNWDAEFWEHKQDHLFPNLRLLPIVDVEFWDVDNTNDILQLMKTNPNATIVVRGRLRHDDDDCQEYKDIDLTENNSDNHKFDTLDEFHGTIISIAEYTDGSSSGVYVTTPNANALGGELGSQPGLILDKPLVANADNLSLRGMNIYLCSGETNTDSFINYSLIQNNSALSSSIQNAEFYRNNFVLNKNVQIGTRLVEKNVDASDYAAGLIVCNAMSTSFNNNAITARGVGLDFVHKELDSTAVNVYMGVLAGKVVQNSLTKNVLISELNFRTETEDDTTDAKTEINFELAGSNIQDAGIGLYCGKIYKDGSAGAVQRLIVGINPVESNVSLHVKNVDENAATAENLTVGGSVGELENADTVTFSERTGSAGEEARKNGRIEIFLQRNKIATDEESANIPTLNAKNFAGGMAFGTTSGTSRIDLVGQVTGGSKLQGGIYRDEKVIIGTVNLGALIGKTTAGINISNLAVTFDVGGIKYDERNQIIMPDYGDENHNLFEQHLYNFKEWKISNDRTVGLSPFVIENAESSADNAVGGLIGYSQNAELTFSGAISVGGNLDLQVNNGKVSAGGMVGKFYGALTSQTNADANLNKNSLNISVKGDEVQGSENATAYVGGFVGWLYAPNSSGDVPDGKDFEINPNFGSFIYDGNVISNIKDLVFGGTVGKIGSTDQQDTQNNYYDKINISNAHFGGAVKVYGGSLNGGNVTVGGVVGAWDLVASNSASNNVVSKCISYGDVFVNYNTYDTQDGGTTKANTDKLNTYHFGGIVGSAPSVESSASSITVKGNVSLMTSFNSRLTQKSGTADFEATAYKVGAIVGNNSDNVTFDSSTADGPNFYCSQVCMAYQEEDGNIDRQYKKGEDDNSHIYLGYNTFVPDYSSPADAETGAASQKDLTNDSKEKLFGTDGDLDSQKTALASPRDIFDEAASIDINFNNDFSQNGKIGTKLNPLPFASEEEQIVADTNGTYSYGSTGTLSSTHGISWVALTADLTGENARTKSLMANQKDTNEANSTTSFANLAFIGNGRTMEPDPENQGYVKTQQQSLSTGVLNMNYSYGGGLIGAMGKEYDGISTNFNLVSGLVLQENISLNRAALSKVSESQLGNSNIRDFTYFGGVAGKAMGNSFIYGVGVNGEVSVVCNTSAGLVANFESGMINESYSSLILSKGDVTWGANVAGIALITTDELSTETTPNKPGLATIKSTYASGWLSNNGSQSVYTLVCCGSEDAKMDVMDSYSTATATTTGTKNFVNYVNTIGQVVNGSYSLTAAEDPYSFYNASKMAVSYTEKVVKTFDDDDKQPGINSFLGGPNSASARAVNGGYTFSTWYFSPFANDGYATHGFGYLKNVSTYTREEKKELTTGEGEQLDEYNYTAVDYLDILKYGGGTELKGEISSSGTGTSPDQTQPDGKWFLGVINPGKFAQMVNAVSVDYSKNFRFVLECDVVMPVNDASVQSEITYNASRNIGDPRKDFILDGNNHTLDFAQAANLSAAFFNTISGKVENLRLDNINISGSSNANGTLANTFNGELSNVTVIGSLKTNQNVVGGVVGILNGSAKVVKSLVNITAQGGGIVGGVAGKLNKLSQAGEGTSPDIDGTISYSSNAGQIIVTGAFSTEAQKPVYYFIMSDGTLSRNLSRADVVGGIVGRANAGTEISHSYNANAVLGNYTGTTGNAVLGHTGVEAYIAGGIVGYAGADGSTSVKILNNVNTGFVGAGNYYSSTNAYAGGIVGYGNNVVLDGNVNDAGVEALGQMNQNAQKGENYEISIIKINGEPEDNNGINAGGTATGGYTNGIENIKQGKQEKLKPLQYAVTMKYNPGKSRQVYAYGIGFVNGGEFGNTTGDTSTASNAVDSNGNAIANNNYTSTDNIKNDGCIGQVEETRILTFDRQSMYEGGTSGDALKNFWAYFKADDKDNYFVNGFDSYGFPMHLYKTDTMTRTYGRILKGEDGNGVVVQTPLVTEGGPSVNPSDWSRLEGDNGDYYYARPGYEWDDLRPYWGAVGDNRKFVIVDNEIFNWYKDGVKTNAGIYFESNNPSWYYKGVFEKINGDYQTTKWSVDQFGSVKGDEPTFNSANTHDSFLGHSSSTTQTGGLHTSGINEPVFNHEDFLMKQDTTYAEGVTFTGYDTILKGDAVYNDTFENGVVTYNDKTAKAVNTGFGLVAFDASGSNNTPIGAVFNPQEQGNLTVEDVMEEIRQEIEHSSGVNIMNSDATVSSGKDFEQAFLKERNYTSWITISNTNFAGLKIDKDNFVLSNGESGMDVSFRANEDNTDGVSGPFTVPDNGEFQVRFSIYGSASESININFKFTKNEKVTLGRNNVVVNGNDVYIILKNGDTDILQNMNIDSNENLNKITANKFYLNSFKIDDYIFERDGFSYMFDTVDGKESWGDVPYIKFNRLSYPTFTLNNLDGNSLTLNFDFYGQTTQDVNVVLEKSTQGSEDFTIEPEQMTQTVTFEGFEHYDSMSQFENTLSISENWIDATSGEEESPTVKKFALAAFEEASNGKIAFGNGAKNYGLNYTTEGGWKVFGCDGNGQITLNNSQTVTLEIKQEDGNYLYVTGDAGAVNAFVTEFGNFAVYVNKNFADGSITASGVSKGDKTQTVSKTNFDITSTYKLAEERINNKTTNEEGEDVFEKTAPGFYVGDDGAFFLGDDFDDFDGGNKDTTSHFGLDFVTQTFDFVWNFASAKVQSKLGENVGLEITEKDSGKIAYQGYFASGAEKEILALEPGKTYSISYLKYSATKAEDDASLENDFTFTKDGKTYSVIKGTTSEVDENDLAGIDDDDLKDLLRSYAETKYVQTTCENSWEYYVYENGVLRVDYTIENNITEFISDGKTIWKITTAGSEYNVEKVEDGSNPFKEFEDVSIDFVATGCEEDEVFFANNSFEQMGTLEEDDTEHGKVTIKMNVPIKQESGGRTYSLGLIQKNDLAESKEFGAGDTTIKWTDKNETGQERTSTGGVSGLKYKPENTLSWTQQGGSKLEETKFGEFTYDVKIDYLYNFVDLEQPWAAVVNQIEEIYLDRDVIVVVNNNVDNNQKLAKINGNGHIITFVGKGAFLTNATALATLDDIKFVSMSSYKDVNNKPYISIKRDEGDLVSNKSINNIQFYGSIRNITGDSNSSLLLAKDREENEIEVQNVIESFMVLHSLDGKDGDEDNINGQNAASINDFIYNKNSASADVYVSHNILIAGDGGNGANGFDKGANSNQRKGGNAGAGASVTITGETNGFEGFVKLGAKGMPGFGGNAANSSYSGLSGGVQGESVSQDSKVKTKTGNEEPTDNQEKTEGAPIRTITDANQYAGNSGTKQVTQVNSGSAENGMDSKYKHKFKTGSNHIVMWFGVQSSNDSEHYWDYDDVGNKGNAIDDSGKKWSDNIIAGEADSWRNVDKKVFVSIKTGQSPSYNWNGLVYQNRNVLQWRKVVWTSGESVNSGYSDKFIIRGIDQNGNEKTFYKGEMIDVPAEWDLVPDTYIPGDNSGKGASVQVKTPWDTTLTMTNDGSEWHSASKDEKVAEIIYWDPALNGGAGNWKYTNSVSHKTYHYNPSGTYYEDLLKGLYGENGVSKKDLWAEVYTSGLEVTAAGAYGGGTKKINTLYTCNIGDYDIFEKCGLTDSEKNILRSHGYDGSGVGTLTFYFVQDSALYQENRINNSWVTAFDIVSGEDLGTTLMKIYKTSSGLRVAFYSENQIW